MIRSCALPKSTAERSKGAIRTDNIVISLSKLPPPGEEFVNVTQI